MTKLCNACEYLKFCARSGIEDVGCDRYKRDMTTNEKWLRSAATEQLAEVISDFYLLGYTHGHNKLDITSRTKWTEWLKKPHIEVEE